MLAGLAFKISAVPFHMWTPDVYEGSPTPVTAYFAAAAKMSAMAMVIRVILGAFPACRRNGSRSLSSSRSPRWRSARSPRSGRQNIKRLLAYSSIGHVGYALIGLAAGNAGGRRRGHIERLIYLTIYLAMTLGSFACILAMRQATP